VKTKNDSQPCSKYERENIEQCPVEYTVCTCLISALKTWHLFKDVTREVEIITSFNAALHYPGPGKYIFEIP
jgi:hypothetical protein